MRTVVLTSPAADARSRRALSRALERFPSTVEAVPDTERAAALRRHAMAEDVDWIVVVDADAEPEPNAFAGLQRVLSAHPAIVGGRALIGESQRLGAMFGPSRSGPNPFQLVVLTGLHSDRQLSDLVRGPIDAPQRGIFFVAADFVRSLAGADLDPVLLHLDLAVAARAAGRAVLCEPSLSFAIDEDSRALRGRLVDLRRYARAAHWVAHELHRDPVRLRSAFITREIRIMGNYRGFIRRPVPPIEVLAVPGSADGDVLRRALCVTGDRYVLVNAATSALAPAALEPMIERIERDSRTALVVESAAVPFGAALFHCGRIVNAAGFDGATIDDVIASALAQLPPRGLVATRVASAIVPPPTPRVTGTRTLDVIFVAASKPTVTHQTLQALLSEPVNGTVTAVYPAGATTTERMFAVHTGLQRLPDASDVQLAIGLNRALGAARSDAIAIIRDDAQIPHGFLARLQSAFTRIPRLGAAVPRVGGSGRPESLPEQSYRNSAEMQAVYDRRAERFARQTMLLDVATAPVIMVSREALEVVGGFDERFGFSRIGVEDFTRRLRSANFLVACCEDAYAHLFPFAEATSFIANIDDSPFLRAAFDERWAAERGFDPARDRVPLRTGEPPRPAEKDGWRILMPLGSEEEWQRVRPLLTELVGAFRVNDAVEVAVGLDGALQLQTVLREIRELLLASNVPMEETLNVTIDFVPDLSEWREAGARRNARLAGIERDALDDLPVVDGAAGARALMAAVTA